MFLFLARGAYQLSVVLSRFILLLCVACVLTNCGAEQNQYIVDTPDGKASIAEVRQTKYLLSHQQTQATIQYLPPQNIKIRTPVDILILFDRTGSMRNVIESTADASTDIVKQVQTYAPNTRFAVASVSDYSPLFSSSKDKRTWLLDADFTLEAANIANAIANIKLVKGGDLPEAYSRGLNESTLLNWRADAKKIIVFFGDSTDHPIDPGRDEKLGTTDDLTMPSVLAKLKAQGINVIGIHTRNTAEVIQQFEQIGQSTGGATISLDDASAATKTIQSSIKTALAKPAALQAIGEHADWVSTQTIGGEGKVDYKININLPENTPAGVYPIQLFLTPSSEDDFFANSIKEQPFEIKVITGWINHPLLIWLPLVLFLVYLLWSSMAMLKGGYQSLISVTSNEHYDINRYQLAYLWLDILAYSSLVSLITAVYLYWHGLVLSQLFA